MKGSHSHTRVFRKHTLPLTATTTSDTTPTQDGELKLSPLPSNDLDSVPILSDVHHGLEDFVSQISKLFAPKSPAISTPITTNSPTTSSVNQLSSSTLFSPPPPFSTSIGDNGGGRISSSLPSIVINTGSSTTTAGSGLASSTIRPSTFTPLPTPSGALPVLLSGEDSTGSNGSVTNSQFSNLQISNNANFGGGPVTTSITTGRDGGSNSQTVVVQASSSEAAITGGGQGGGRGGSMPTQNQVAASAHDGLSPGFIAAIILTIVFATIVLIVVWCQRMRKRRRNQTVLGWTGGAEGQRNRVSLAESFRRTIESTGSTRSRSSTFTDDSSLLSEQSMSERTVESHMNPPSFSSHRGESRLSIISITASSVNSNYPDLDQPVQTPTRKRGSLTPRFVTPLNSPSAEHFLLGHTPVTPTRSECEPGSSSTKVNKIAYPVITSYRPLTGKIPPIPPLPTSPPPIPEPIANPFMDQNPFEDPVD